MVCCLFPAAGFRRADKGIKERLVCRFFHAEGFRMPLDAEYKPFSGQFDRLSNPVRGLGGNGQAFAQSADALVVAAVDGKGIRADNAVQEGAGLNGDLVDGGGRCVMPRVLQGASGLGGDILPERASEDAGKQLHSPADGQDGDVPVQQILKILHDSGYDGYYSLEFEGIEETVSAIEISMENLNRMLKSIEG